MTGPHLFALAAGASALLHAGAWAGLGAVPERPPEQLEPSAVDFTVAVPEPVAEPEAPEPEAEPEAPEPAAPEPGDVAEPTAAGDAPATEPAEEAPATEAPAEEAPTPSLDLTGVTLTNDGDGEAWSSAVGDGSAITQPQRNVKRGARRGGSGSRATKPRPKLRAEQPKPKAPPHVALANLSRKPRAPNLNGALEAHYPAAARAAGISGTATVSARITAAGSATSVRVVSESHPGFGAACRATLSGSRWSPPLDERGRAVSTTVTYRCQFRVRR